MERDYGISVTRIIATIFIVLCHGVQLFDKFSFLGSIFDVGVPIFLLISGILYGRKMTYGNNIIKFYIKNYFKLWIPMCLWLCLIMICYLRNGQIFELTTILCYVFNMQGVSWLFDNWFNVELIGDVGILWFLTVIMLCYIIYPAFIKYKEIFMCKKFWLLLTLLVLLLNFYGIHLWYIWEFCFGLYFFDSLQKKINTKLRIVIFTMICFFTEILRLIIRVYMDGTIFYKYVVVSVTHFVFALWIILIVCMLYSRISKPHSMDGSSYKIIKYFDGLSFYVYIVHYTFLRGIFSLYLEYLFKNNIVVWFIILTCFILISAQVLKFLTDKIILRINKILCQF